MSRSSDGEAPPNGRAPSIGQVTVHPSTWTNGLMAMWTMSTATKALAAKGYRRIAGLPLGRVMPYSCSRSIPLANIGISLDDGHGCLELQERYLQNSQLAITPDALLWLGRWLWHPIRWMATLAQVRAAAEPRLIPPQPASPGENARETDHDVFRPLSPGVESIELHGSSLRLAFTATTWRYSASTLVVPSIARL